MVGCAGHGAEHRPLRTEPLNFEHWIYWKVWW